LGSAAISRVAARSRTAGRPSDECVRTPGGTPFGRFKRQVLAIASAVPYSFPKNRSNRIRPLLYAGKPNGDLPAAVAPR